VRAGDVLRLAKDHMAASKLRTALTVLGIIMGVMAMTAILSVSEGFGIAIRESMETYFNTRLIFVTGIGTLGEQQAVLYTDDVEYISNRMDDLVDEAFPGVFYRARVIVNSTYWSGPYLLMGSSHEKGLKVWPTLYVPLAGRIPSDRDRRGVVLGYRVAAALARELAKSEDPSIMVGRSISLVIEMPMPSLSEKIEVEMAGKNYTITYIMIYRIVTVKVRAVLKETGVNLAGFDVDNSIIGTLEAVKKWIKPPEPTSEAFAAVDAVVRTLEGEEFSMNGIELEDLMKRAKADGETLWSKYERWYETNMADYDRRVSIIVVYTKSTDCVEEVMERLNAYFGATGRQPQIIAMKAYARAIEGVMGIFRSLLIVLGIIAVVVASLGVFNTMTTNVRERVKEIGIMKAIGATSGTVLKLFWTEAILMGLVGSFLGVLAGWGAAWLIAATGLLKGVVAFGAVFTVTAEPVMTVEIAVASFSVAMVTTAIFGYIPARWASKYDPVVALRYE